MRQKELFSFIREISGQANVLTIPRVFIKITGDIKSALFLSQCCYWAGKMNNRYFYKSYSDWEEEIGLTRYELDSARNKVSEYVMTEIKKANGAPTLHYFVDFEKLENKLFEVLNIEKPTNGFVENQQIEFGKSDKSLTVDYNNKNINNEPVEYIDCDDDGEILEEKKNRKNNNGKVFAIAKALEEVTGMSLALNDARIFKEARILVKDERVNPELIRNIFGAGGVWYKQDWRGKLGQKPKIGNIKETIFAFEVEKNNNEIKGDIYSR